MAEKKGQRQASAKKKVASGDSYACETCGLVVSVDEVCGCIDFCDIVCCGKPMQQRKIKVKAAK